MFDSTVLSPYVPHDVDIPFSCCGVEFSHSTSTPVGLVHYAVYRRKFVSVNAFYFGGIVSPLYWSFSNKKQRNSNPFISVIVYRIASLGSARFRITKLQRTKFQGLLGSHPHGKIPWSTNNCLRSTLCHHHVSEILKIFLFVVSSYETTLYKSCFARPRK
jgi:hypothetical protein